MHGATVKIAVILVGVQCNLNFLDGFSKNTATTHYMQIHEMGAEFLHADGQTDRHDEANSRISQFREHSLENETRVCPLLSRLCSAHEFYLKLVHVNEK
jgi:hypothetical protein